MSERSRDGSLKLHALVSDGMGETQQVSVQTETVERVIAIAILHVARNIFIYGLTVSVGLVI